MKKLITATLLLISLQSFAQDTATVRNLSLQARTIEYLAPVMSNNIENDSLYTTFLNLRAKFRVTNPPSGTTLVVVDSIPTVELANLYNYIASNSDGMAQLSSFKTQISSARTANAYLDRLLDAVDDFWQDRIVALRASGRRLLRGK